jgi:RHS repeat-associated protein
MKNKVLAMTLACMAVGLGDVAYCQCSSGDPIKPIKPIEFTSVSGSAALCGFPEFGTPSTPPQRYRAKEKIGSMRKTTWASSSGCAAQVGQWGTFSLACSFQYGSDYFSGGGTMAVIPPQAPGGQCTVIISGLWGTVNGQSVPVWCVHGGAQQQNGSYTDWWPSSPYPTVYGLKFISNAPYAGLCYPIGTIAWGGSTPLHTLEDTWDYAQQYIPGACALQEPEDNSTRHLDGLLQVGGPSESDYAGFSTDSSTNTKRAVTGTGTCVQVGSNWCKLTGTVTEQLSDEDTESDAMARARAAAVSGTSHTAFETTLDANLQVEFCDAHYKGQFDVPCSGEYDVCLYYSVKTHGATDPVTSRVVTERRVLESGLQTIEGNIEHPEKNTDYTLDGIELQKPCAGTEPGNAYLRTSSIDARLSLGRSAAGASAGELRLVSDTVTASVYTPAALVPATIQSGSIEITRDTSGTLRQAKAPQALADIVTINPSSYEVRFYPLSQVGAQDPGTSVYAVSGTPFVAYRFENPDAAQNLTTRLRITETRGGLSRVNEYSFDSNAFAWSLSRGDGLRQESVATAIVGGNKVKTTTVRDASNQVVSKVARTYHTYPWGEELISEVLDPDSAALATQYEFYDGVSTSDPNYGRLRQRTKPDGSWERSIYEAGNRTLKTIRPFLDAPASTTDESLCRVTENIYDTIADADGDGQAEARTTTIERILDQETARRYRVDWSKSVTLGGESFQRKSEIVCVEAGAAWNAPANLVTETLTYTADPFIGRVRRVVNPDGTATMTTYALDASGVLTGTVKTGQPNGTLDDIVSGTRTVTVTNASGQVTSESTADLASGLTLSLWMATEFDSLNRPTRRDFLDGTFEARSYACCGLESLTDRQGITTSYIYDALGRLQFETRAGIGTRYTYDPEGRLLARTRIGSDSTEITLETNAYDVAGRRTSTKDALNRQTSFSETFNANSQTVRTAIAPDGGTRVETLAKDGSTLSVSGTAAAPLKYEYGVDASGVFTKEIRVGDGGEETEWFKNYTDFAGRTYKTVYADSAVAQSYFDSGGQLVKQVDPDGVTTLFADNALGEQEYAALDVDRNGVIDYSGTDRITRVRREVTTAHDTTVTRLTTTGWTTDSTADTQTVSVAETSADGMQSWQTINGLTTHTQIVFGGGGARTETTTTPDNTIMTRQFSNDRLASETTAHSSIGTLTSTTYAYDPHGRVLSFTDARAGATSYTYYADDRVHTVITPDPDPNRSGDGYDPQTTTYEYDSAGRLWKTMLPDGGLVTNEYYATGSLKKMYGARTYPVEYTYDSQGRIKTLKTWQDFAGNAGTATTTWNYDSQRGWLNNKRYADNQGPSYTYTAAGRLATRTWARGVVTAYGYSNAGNLTSISYSDTTPAVALGCDRLGRVKTTTDVAGALTRTFHASGQLQNETYGPTGLLANLAITREFDSLDRLSGLTPSPSLPSVSYIYDAASRLQAVTSGPTSATYGYLADSPMVETITFKNGTDTRLTTAKVYDKLNRLASTSSAPSASSVLSHAYTYNSANQRTRATREDGAYWSYTYDALGQVTSGTKHLADSTPVPGHAYGWTFDDIGNRKTATVNSRTAAFIPSSLNQYSQRTVPGVIDVAGAANAQATVTVTFPAASSTVLPVTRQGELFYKQLAVDNSSAAQYAQVKVTGVKNLAGPNGEDAVQEETRSAFVAKTPEVFSYDADGNLTSDGRWTFGWDGENRLVAMETQPAAATGVARHKLEFGYDGQSRRVSKKVYDWSGGDWVRAGHTLFLYDGWNMVAELDALTGNAAFRTYVWGPDLSGSMQGAGGVGGLLFVSLGSVTYAAAYDGNGNVIGLADMSSGARSADYEYAAFGETMKIDGPASTANPFRFSTKYTDTETGHLYYGLRYYNPSTGRWPSRDPIEEQGGVNLYAMCGNDPLNHVDLLGLWGAGDHEQMTRGAWANANLPEGMRAYQNQMAAMLIQENSRADGDWMSLNFWHFNRDLDENIDAAVRRYTSNLNAERQRIGAALARPNKENCRRAMERMGNLSHAFQDYYAHAILRTSNGTNNIGRVTGNPNALGPDMKPASWGTWYGDRGEHGASEPGNRAPDSADRKRQSQDFTTGEFRTFAADWWRACECYAKEIYSN